MKKKMIKQDMFRSSIIYIIGTREEISSWFTKEFVKSGEYVKRDKKFKEEVLSNLSTGVHGFSNGSYQSVEDGYTVYIVGMVSDCKPLQMFQNKGNKKEFKKKFCETHYHELRHLADQIIKDNYLMFEDFELTARLQAWINVELDDIKDEYLEEVLL